MVHDAFPSFPPKQKKIVNIKIVIIHNNKYNVLLIILHKLTQESVWPEDFRLFS